MVITELSNVEEWSKFKKEMDNHPSEKLQLMRSLLLCEHSDLRLIKLFLMIERDVNNWIHGEGDAFLKFLSAHDDDHSMLIRFIVENIRLLKISEDDLDLSSLITDGYIEFLFQFFDLNEQFFKQFASSCKFMYYLFNRLFQAMCFHLLKYLASMKSPTELNVFTTGANDNMSLGNPLGTSKRHKISFNFDVQDHFSPTQIEIGSHSTFFWNPLSNLIFVSGKFGAQHYMTPEAFELEENVSCVAVGISHAIICCKKFYYIIGDNSKNQLGCGPTVPNVTRLKRFDLPNFMITEMNQIISCATSNNHTIIQMENDLLVCGTNVGQMGKYASRAFQQETPKSFIRMLRPGDPTLVAHSLKVSVANDATLVFSGHKAKLFFEYQEQRILIPKEMIIHNGNICKLPFSGQTLLVLCTENFDVYVWRKSIESDQLEPTWRFMNNFIDPLSPISDCTLATDSFICSQSGELLLCRNCLVYTGSLSINNDTNDIECHVEFCAETPGFVQNVFMSGVGGNVGFITFPNRSRKDGNAYNVVRFRHRLFLMNSIKNGQDAFDDEIVKIVGKGRTYRVHKFMLTLRAPTCLQLLNGQGEISLKRYADETVSEALQFIYLNTTQTLRLMAGDATEHELDVLMESRCSTCGSSDPFLHFASPFTADDSTGEQRSCSAAAPRFEELVENMDVIEILEKNLYRLMQFSKELGMLECCSCVRHAFDGIQEKTFNVSLQNFLLEKTFDANLLFPDGTVVLNCENGQIKFSRYLLCEIPYFEALHRWDNDEEVGETSTVRIDGVSTEIVQLMLRFLLVKDLDGVNLKFDQMLELLYVADRYMFVELMEHLVDILEEKIHLDNIADIVEMTNVFVLDRLDQAVVNFIVFHLPFMFTAKFRVLRMLPGRILQLLQRECVRLFSSNATSTFGCVFSEETLKQRGDFERVVGNYLQEVLNIDLYADDVSLEEFIRAIEKSKNAERAQKRFNTSVSEDAPTQVVIGADDISIAATTSELESENDVDSSVNIVNEFLAPHSAISQKCDVENAVSPNVMSTPQRKIESSCWNLDSTITQTTPISTQLYAAVAVDYKEKMAKRSAGSRCQLIPHRNNKSIDIINSIKEKSPLSAWTPNFSPQTPPKQTLNEIMEEENKNVKQQMNNHAKHSETPSTSSPISINRISNVWDTSKCSPGSPSWSRSPLTTATASHHQAHSLSPNSPPNSLRAIQEDEVVRNAKAEAARRYRKPIHLMELEERAGQELEDYYATLYGADHPVFLVVRRVPNEYEDCAVALAANIDVDTMPTSGVERMTLYSGSTTSSSSRRSAGFVVEPLICWEERRPKI